MFFGKNEVQEFINEIKTPRFKFKLAWFEFKKFLYTFKYVFDYNYSFFTKRYYGALIKINNIWYYLPNLKFHDEMHYSRTVFDINGIIAKSSTLSLISGHQVQDICIITFKKTFDGDMRIQKVFTNDINEFYRNERKTIPLTTLVDLRYTFK